MARLRMTGPEVVLDSSEGNAAITIPVGGMELVSIQAFAQSGTFAGTYTIEISNDGTTWSSAAYINHDSGTLTTVSNITAAGVTRAVPVKDVQYLRIRNSVSGGTARIQFSIYGEGAEVITSQRQQPGLRVPGPDIE